MSHPWTQGDWLCGLNFFERTDLFERLSDRGGALHLLGWFTPQSLRQPGLDRLQPGAVSSSHLPCEQWDCSKWTLVCCLPAGSWSGSGPAGIWTGALVLDVAASSNSLTCCASTLTSMTDQECILILKVGCKPASPCQGSAVGSLG